MKGSVRHKRRGVVSVLVVSSVFALMVGNAMAASEPTAEPGLHPAYVESIENNMSSTDGIVRNPSNTSLPTPSVFANVNDNLALRPLLHPSTMDDVPASMSGDAAYELLVQVVQAIRVGDLSRARELLDQAIDITTEHAIVWAMSARLELMRGNPNVALEHADRSVAEEPGNPVVRWFRAFTRILTTENDQPYRVRDLAGARVYPLIERALELMEEGDYDGARVLVDRALVIDPNNAYVWMISGDLELRRGNTALAREHLTRALDLDSDLGQARLVRGLIYIQDREYSAARADLSWAILSDQLTYDEVQISRDAIISIGGEPPYVPVDHEYEQQRLFDEAQDRVDVLEEADRLAASNNLNDAVLLLRSWNDESPEYLLQRADFYLGAGYLDEALGDYETIMNASASSSEERATAARRAAPIYEGRGDYSAAVDALLLADRIHGLSLSEQRDLTQFARLAPRLMVLIRQLRRLQRDGLTDERTAAGFELAEIHVDAGDLSAAQSALQTTAEDTQVEIGDRIRAWTSFAGYAELQNDPERAQIAYVRAADLAGGNDAQLEQFADRSSVDVVPQVQRTETASVSPTPALRVEAGSSSPSVLPRPVVQPQARSSQGQQRVSSTPTPIARPAPSAGNRAYRLQQNGRCAEAIPFFTVAYQNTSDAEFLLARGYCQIELDQVELAIGSLEHANANPSGLNPDQRLELHKTLAYLYEDQGQYEAASIAWADANAISSSAETELGQSRTLRAAGHPEQAFSHLERAQQMDPDNLDVRLALAYALLAEGRDGEAISHFEHVLAHANDQYYRAHEDLAYAYKRQGNRDLAAQHFRRVVDNQGRYPSGSEEERQQTARRIYNVRREITELERRWYAYGAVVYRDGGFQNPGPLQSDQSQSQASFEAGWIPGHSNYAIGSGYALFGRLYSALEPNSFALQEDSIQGGVGVHYKPFEELGVVLTAERLIKIGESSRNAWLFSAAHSWGIGGDWRPGEQHWRVANTYAEAAYIPDDPSYMSLFGQAFVGEAFPIADRTAIIPHAVASLRYSEDSFNGNTIGDAGLGVSLRHWYGEDFYHGPRGTIDLQAQYRWYLIDDTTPMLDSDGAFIARLVVTY